MKLFGNTRRPVIGKFAAEEEGPLPQFPAPEAVADFDLSGKDFDETLRLLLDGDKLDAPAQLAAEPSKETQKPGNTDFHVVHEPICGTKAVIDDEEDDEDEAAPMAGWLKGVLMLLSSAIIFALVIFGVYQNLI